MKRSPKQLVKFERNTPTRNAAGTDVDSWATIAVVWCDLRPMGGNERQAAMQVVPEATWRAFCRHQPGLSLAPSDRATWNGKTFEIVSVQNVMNQDRITQIDLKEHV